MTPQNQLSWKNEPCSKSSLTQLCSFQADTWENVHLSSKPRHVNPQINHLGETRPVLRVPTAIYTDSKQLEMSPVLMVSTHIYGVSQEIDRKTFIFQGKLGM